jgi:hypothetical protein
MMTEEQATALGKRAVAAGWRVWPGQLSLSGIRCTVTPMPLSPRPIDTPDFRDPATLGILLTQVRERWDDSTIHAQFYEETWRVAYWNPDNFFWAYWPEESFTTEIEALVACLEAPK